MKIAFFLLPLFLGFLSCGNAQNNNDKAGENVADSLATPGVTEYLGVNGPFTIGDYTFHLRWSSHPTDLYYKQEYVPTRYDLEKYIQMVMVEVAIGDQKIKELMAAKIEELDARKSTDQLVKYTVSRDPRTGADVLEFMLSENYPGDDAIAEWNVYRYVPYKGSSGQKGIQLFAYSRRGYGMKAEPFLGDIDRHGVEFKTNFLAIPVPAVKLK